MNASTNRTTIVTDIAPRDMASNVAMWAALANGAEWTDATTPRTARPVRLWWTTVQIGKREDGIRMMPRAFTYRAARAN